MFLTSCFLTLFCFLVCVFWIILAVAVCRSLDLCLFTVRILSACLSINTLLLQSPLILHDTCCMYHIGHIYLFVYWAIFICMMVHMQHKKEIWLKIWLCSRTSESMKTIMKSFTMEVIKWIQSPAGAGGGDFLYSLFLLLSPSTLFSYSCILQPFVFLSKLQQTSRWWREQMAGTKEDIFISCQH